jgi:hypothetical protein
MVWIGGGQGAGKTILGWRLSRANDLPLHRIDLWTYDHVERMPPARSLDDELAAGPEAAADAFESRSRDRLELVLDDIRSRGLGDVPAIVEGPQLMPVFADQVAGGWAVWLVPDPARTRAVYEERLTAEESLAGHPVAGRSRLARALERNAVLAGRVRATANGRPVIEVPAEPDWTAIAASLEIALGPALRSAPRLSPGSVLSGQRRYENKAAERQGRLWTRAAGLAEPPTYPFGCECGASGCAATWTATPGEYAAHDGPLIAHRARGRAPHGSSGRSA